MGIVNFANRQVCDVDIRILSTMAPFLKFDNANTTTAGLTSDSVYAMSKGRRKIAFQNPLEGTMTIEAQVYPFKLFALLADGTIHSDAAYAVTKTVTAVANGALPVAMSGGTVKAGTVFVYPAGQFGEEDAAIAGTFATGTFTATNSADIVSGNDYEVGFIVTRSSGVKRISFNNNNLPKDYYITMQTLNKAEDGTYTPFLITAYKASIQRSFDLSFSSEGDPASVTLTFDLLEDSNKNVMDMVEIEDVSMSVSKSALTLKQGATSSDIRIDGATGVVTATIKDSSDAAYAKLHAIVSGDNDTVIVYADDDAAVAEGYKVILTDAGSSQTATIVVKVTAA